VAGNNEYVIGFTTTSIAAMICRRVASTIALFAVGWLVTPSSAASISYGSFGPVPPGVTFADVVESSATDPVPLFRPPTPFSVGLDFDPASFAATASGGNQDAIDSQLNFIIASDPLIAITNIGLSEAGDYSLVGVGGVATQALASSILQATVTQLNGVDVVPLALLPVDGSVSFNLAANSAVVQPWSLGLFLNVDGQLGPGQWATKVEVAIQNHLMVLSETSSVAYIAKKDFRFDVVTEQVPEPATLLILLSGGLAWLAVRSCRI
jgi:hypothetical protein